MGVYKAYSNLKQIPAGDVMRAVGGGPRESVRACCLLSLRFGWPGALLCRTHRIANYLASAAVLASLDTAFLIAARGASKWRGMDQHMRWSIEP